MYLCKSERDPADPDRIILHVAHGSPAPKHLHIYFCINIPSEKYISYLFFINKEMFFLYLHENRISFRMKFDKRF